jgi:hypothetical protein
MNETIKIIITKGPSCIFYEGIGLEGRRYSIQKMGSEYIASLISGSEQHIAASGNSPLQALIRVESVQRTELLG